MDEPDDGEPVHELRALDRVAADDDRSRLVHLVGASPQQLAERLERHVPLGEHDDVERGDRSPPHRVDVAERVRRGHLPEDVGIVDDRREKIDGENERRLVVHAHDGAVIRLIASDDEVGMTLRGQRFRAPATTPLG